MPRISGAFVLVLTALMPAFYSGELLYAAGMNHADHTHHGHTMTLDSGGMTMHENRDRLPEDCPALGPDVKLTVYAGAALAANIPGAGFGFSEYEYRVPPCSRVTVTLINKDSVRHQWMVHGLPKYLYPQGMFHLETAGGQQRTGTFIVPGDDKTYLVHCDMAQHMEKGMKAQLVVGKGDGDLPNIPGISRNLVVENQPESSTMGYLTITGAAAAVLGIYLAVRKRR